PTRRTRSWSTPDANAFRGTRLLAPLLKPHGFRFRITWVDRGSGGSFAVGRYSHGKWWLELHVREALGIVNYGYGDTSIEHRPYMEILGVRDQAEYPGFSTDPVDSFRHLRPDLERHAGVFLRRDQPNPFQSLCREGAERERARMAPFVQGMQWRDVRQRAEAAWKRRDYAAVAAAYGQIKDPLTPAEARRLEFARRHV